MRKKSQGNHSCEKGRVGLLLREGHPNGQVQLCCLRDGLEGDLRGVSNTVGS